MLAKRKWRCNVNIRACNNHASGTNPAPAHPAARQPLPCIDRISNAEDDAILPMLRHMNPSSTSGVRRCPWAESNALQTAYHDSEWGVPVHDERRLFEFLILEGAQAGLSWDTILRKRENYRAVFDDFNAEKIARYNDRKIAALMADPGIVRNRLKIESAVSNACCFLDVRDRFGSFDPYIWQFIGGVSKQNRWRDRSRVPASTAESDAMSRALKKLGFRFVGTTICYAFMQATGMVNDHLTGCFRHHELAA
jgi:DNA-3-methyladenine glycosylase I